MAFGVLGNGGVYQEPISFLGISDSNGNVVYDSHAQQERRQVFRPSTAWMAVDMMKTVVSSGTAKSAKISGQTVAGKTGTNSDQRGVTFCGMTGWYVSSIWVGHDNYKPLSSKSTGSNGALPIWQSYMEKIHKAKSLSDRDIIEVSAEEVELVKVTTCAVSGQLATDACYNDSMGYGVVTDYWYAPTVPTVSCQMHQAVSVCAETGYLATEYCPNTTVSGVVVIPSGHPLSAYANDGQYASVIAEYLGTASSLGYCPYHTSAGSYQDNTYDSGLVSDARQLLQSAYDLMSMLDASQPAYLNIQMAASNLENVIMGNPSTAEIASAMAALTQAMASAY